MVCRGEQEDSATSVIEAFYQRMEAGIQKCVKEVPMEC